MGICGPDGVDIWPLYRSAADNLGESRTIVATVTLSIGVVRPREL